ncbi:Dynein light chain, cytoplasmic [Anabarilius grahami]|uniref:Dynein light chain n=2 Tax=Xenocypridinae TaxID=2743747 RepID=A0A3N0XLB5_ANAGA|nr:Dynein light chain, cytoplasmic [Anabarilius grahami]
MEILTTKMSDEMQREVLQVALLAVNMYTKDNDIATNIKKEFERKHGGTWHCIIGSSGYNVKLKCYINVSVGDKDILLFRTD